MSSMSKLSTAYDFMDSTMPFVMWIAGLLLIGDAVWQFGYLPEIAQYPRMLVFLSGIAIWLGGSVARGEKKRVAKLERKVSTLERERDEYKEAYFEAIER